MTIGAETHRWKRPAIERDLFDYLIRLGWVTFWFDRRLISEVLRTDKERRDKVSAALRR